MLEFVLQNSDTENMEKHKSCFNVHTLTDSEFVLNISLGVLKRSTQLLLTLLITTGTVMCIFGEMWESA